jgi:WD40 repeat protein
MGGTSDQHYMTASPEGRNLLVVGHTSGQAALVPLDGGAPRDLPIPPSAWVQSPAFSRDGRLVAAGVRGPEDNLIQIWGLQSGEVRTLDPRPKDGEKECGRGSKRQSAVWQVAFTSDGRLLSAGWSGLRVWDLDEGTNTLLRSCTEETQVFPNSLGGSLEDRYLLVEVGTERPSLLSFHDLRAGVSRELTSHGNELISAALDSKGEIAVTGGLDGIVRVGPVTGEEPHLLHGHDLSVWSVAVSPDGQWIASGGNDGTIRLWPMPDVTKPPPHTLPHEELLAKLRAFTNLRVARDEAAETGYRLEAGPFPGWETVPTW